MSDTLPAFLAANALRLPKRIALRDKQLGIWREVTWPAYAAAVAALARGFAGLGLGRGERIAILLENRPEWLYAELAAQSLGAAAAGLHADLTGAELAGHLRALRPRLIVVEGQAQVEALFAERPALDGVEAVLYRDERGMRGYTDARLRPLDALREHGGGATPPRAGEARPEDVATILLTAGVGGEARLVELTHANLLAAARGFLELEPVREGADFVSIAPASWIGDRIFAGAVALVAGLTVNFPEEAETVAEDLREIGPELVVAPPRAWERLRAAVEADSRGVVGLTRRVLRAAFAAPAGNGASPRPLPASFAGPLVYRPARDRIGLLRAKHCFSLGGPLDEDVHRFFTRIGVPIRQVYGLTEAAGIVAVEPAHGARPGAVGVPLPGLEVAIGHGGEIRLRGPQVARSVIGSTLADEAGMADGWRPSGDLGALDDGHVLLLDRRGRAVRLADGGEAYPAAVEARLRGSPYIRHAVVLLDGAAGPSALIGVDGAMAGAWAQRHGQAVTTHAELVAQPGLVELIVEAVREANAGLPHTLRVQRIALIEHELSVETGELTRIGQPRRPAILARNEAAVDALGSPTPGRGVHKVECALAEVR